MTYIYKTVGTCASQIKFDLNDDIVTNVEFTNGCSGNLKAIPRLIDGWTVDAIEGKCKGITCGRKPTSCADQLAIAVRTAYEQSKQEEQPAKEKTNRGESLA